MKIQIQRKWKKASYSIGRLYVDGVYVCNTLEDRDRGLYDWQSEQYIKSKKVYGETAIPLGTYKVILSYSPKFSPKSAYKNIGGGKVPEILGVKGFTGIRIHIGNSASNSLGCILVGENKQVGMVLNSTATYKMLMEKYLLPAYNRGEEITLEIL